MLETALLSEDQATHRQIWPEVYTTLSPKDALNWIVCYEYSLIWRPPSIKSFPKKILIKRGCDWLVLDSYQQQKETF